MTYAQFRFKLIQQDQSWANEGMEPALRKAYESYIKGEGGEPESTDYTAERPEFRTAPEQKETDTSPDPIVQSTPSRSPTGSQSISQADPIASALNTFGWIILVVAFIFGLVLALNVDGYVGLGILVAGLFQALLLMGFARIINYLKTLVDQGGLNRTA